MDESKSCEAKTAPNGHPARERDVDRDDLVYLTALDVQYIVESLRTYCTKGTPFWLLHEQAFTATCRTGNCDKTHGNGI